jgi:hypothetical protein
MIIKVYSLILLAQGNTQEAQMAYIGRINSLLKQLIKHTEEIMTIFGIQ